MNGQDAKSAKLFIILCVLAVTSDSLAGCRATLTYSYDLTEAEEQPGQAATPVYPR